jgi:hypothetical protein
VNDLSRTGGPAAAPAPARLVFREPFGIVSRILIGAFGLLTFIVPWDLLIRPYIDPFQWRMWPAWLISIAALSIGVPFVLAAALGFDRTVTLDFSRNTISERGRGTLGIGFARTRPLDSVTAIVIVKEGWSDGPPHWRVEARFTEKVGTWDIALRDTREAAEQLAMELSIRLGLWEPL